MNFNEFSEMVDIVLGGVQNYASRWDESDGFKIEDGFIVQVHISGGAEGGNCWGEEARNFSNPEIPEKFLPLDEILRQAKPEVSYLKYREIEDLIETSETTEYEYYGNHTHYTIFKLDIRKLYDKLFPNEGN